MNALLIEAASLGRNLQEPEDTPENQIHTMLLKYKDETVEISHNSALIMQASTHDINKVGLNSVQPVTYTEIARYNSPVVEVSVIDNDVNEGHPIEIDVVFSINYHHDILSCLSYDPLTKRWETTPGITFKQGKVLCKVYKSSMVTV